MNATDTLTRYAAELTYDQLPPQAVTDIKVHILDTVGAIIAGSLSPAAQRLNDLIVQWGGRAEATILPSGLKVPAPNAALVNSVMSRGFDFETILHGGATHVSASVIPAALAMAEYAQTVLQRPVNGRDFLAAVVLGTDLNWRFRVAGGASTIMAGGWLAETFAPPAIAAMGGLLMGLDREKINFAMGIGYNQCCGTYGATVGDHGGLMAQLSQGLGAKAGVVAVVMAEIGFTAYKDLIDGQWGMYKMYGDGTVDRDILAGDLGTRYDCLRPGIKKFPGCGATQPVVDATLSLVTENNLSADRIQSVRITVGENSYFLCGQDKFVPSETADALWNYRYSVAVACVKGRVFVDDFTESALKEPSVLDFISKIDVAPDKTFRHDIVVEMTDTSGTVYRKAMTDMAPASQEEILEKFKRCCDVSVRPIARDAVLRFIDDVERLESLTDLGALVGLVSGSD